MISACGSKNVQKPWVLTKPHTTQLVRIALKDSTAALGLDYLPACDICIILNFYPYQWYPS